MNILIFVILFLASNIVCLSASIPFKVSKITVDYEQGRKATFTLNIPGLAHGKKRFQIPKVIGVKFIFSNGKIATVPEEALAGIELKSIHSSMIETGPGVGNWFLTMRIKNKKNLTNRIANDWVVFAFQDYKYHKRWLEINDKENVKITGNETQATVFEIK